MALQLGFLLYPGLTQLDLTGPYEVLSRMPDAAVHLIWKQPGVVTSDSGLGMVATRGFDDCPPLDLIFVPGGGGGTIMPGRYNNHRSVPLTNLWLSMADRMGCSGVEKHGDSTGRVESL